MENLFSIIRSKGGKRDNPDAREFRAAFRQVAFDQLLIPSKASNCDQDIDSILLSIGTIGNKSVKSAKVNPEVSDGVQNESMSNQGQIPEECQEQSTSQTWPVSNQSQMSNQAAKQFSSHSQQISNQNQEQSVSHIQPISIIHHQLPVPHYKQSQIIKHHNQPLSHTQPMSVLGQNKLVLVNHQNEGQVASFKNQVQPNSLQTQSLHTHNNNPAVHDLQSPLGFPWLNTILVMKAETNMSKLNTEAYIGGCLLRKARIKECSTCRNQFIYNKAQNTKVYQFLKIKAYKEENTLVYPTEHFIQFVDNLEEMFLKLFEVVMHAEGVLMRLCKSAEQFCTNLLECDRPACALKLRGMVKLFMKVRVFHGLRVSNE